MATFAQTFSSTRQFIKICGLTNLQDAAVCAELEVSAVGILLQKPGSMPDPHDDRLTVAEAAKLISRLPRSLTPVLLVHETQVERVLELCAQLSPGALQIQKSLSPEELIRVKREFPQLSIIKTFRVVRGATVDAVWSEIRSYADPDSIDAVLLDSGRPGAGEVHDWELSTELVKRSTRLPTILAGGLHAGNVRQALRQVRPFGVDVMSGVTLPQRDRKDAAALRAFVAAVREEGQRA